jgi:hypothetical protein
MSMVFMASLPVPSAVEGPVPSPVEGPVPSAVEGPPRRERRGALIRGLFRVERQRHPHGRPFAGLRGDADLAAVVTDNPVHDRQPEAGPLREAAAEGLEDLVEVLAPDAHAIVLNGNHQLPRTAVPGLMLRDRQAQPAPVGHGAQAVGRQVPHDLPDLPSSASYRTSSSGTSTSILWPSQSSALFSSSRAGVGDDLPHVDRRRTGALRPRVGEEAPDRVVQPLRLAQHDVHELRLLGRQRQLLPQDLDRPDIEASGLRISCAIPAAISPTAARRCCTRASRSSLRALGDVLEREQEAGLALRRHERRRAEAHLDLPAVRADEVVLHARKRGRSSRGPKNPTKSFGSCSTSSALADRLMAP